MIASVIRAFFWALIGFVVGLSVAHSTQLHIKPEIDLANLLSFVLTLVLVLLLNLYHERNLKNRQFEKDRLIVLIDAVITCVTRVGDSFQDAFYASPMEQTHKTAILRSLTAYSNALHSLEDALKRCKIKNCEMLIEGAKGQMIGLKQLLTDAPFSRGEFATEDQRSFDGRVKVIRDGLNELLFTINNIR